MPSCIGLPIKSLGCVCSSTQRGKVRMGVARINCLGIVATVRTRCLVPRCAINLAGKAGGKVRTRAGLDAVGQAIYAALTRCAAE